MSVRISITHHEPGTDRALAADVYHVDPYGQISDRPIRRNRIAPGVTEVLHLQRGNVLVLREEPAEPATDMEACA